MGTRLHTRRILAKLLAVAAFAWTGSLRADLAPSSPFLPANGAASGSQAGGTSGPIELRGIMTPAEGPSFCIYDTTKKKGVWVGLNETGHDFVVKEADTAKDAVTVEYQGRSMRLTLRTAKVASSGPVSSGAVDLRGPPQLNPSLSSTVVLNPTPADEQRRLDAVAQEVRRRRMERERAANEAQGGQAQGVVSPLVPGR
jgi:hypothetical protein